MVYTYQDEWANIYETNWEDIFEACKELENSIWIPAENLLQENTEC
jgi:hypothetical protein